MKVFRFTALSFIIIFGLTLYMGISNAEAGDLCWRVDTTTDIEDIRLRVGVVEVGGHYILSGKAVYDPPSAAVGTVHGNAEIYGGSIMLGLVINAGDAEGVWISSFNTVLDFTFNGTYEGTQTIYEYGDPEPKLVYTTGTFTPITCP
jgi:hypothetical protein